MTDPLANHLLSFNAVRAATSLSKSVIYQLIGAGAFPAPVRLSKRRVAFRARDVEAWIVSLKDSDQRARSA